MRALLTLLLLAAPFAQTHAQVLIDPIPLPEPGTLALVCGGVGLVLLRAIKRKR
jgi:hypothetical protein